MGKIESKRYTGRAMVKNESRSQVRICCVYAPNFIEALEKVSAAFAQLGLCEILSLQLTNVMEEVKDGN